MIGFTLQVAAVATVLASLIGIPIGLAIGLGAFRGRRWLQVLANAQPRRCRRCWSALFLFLLFVAAGAARARCS